MKKGKTAVIVGAQWGDEGKGKIVDVLSEGFSVVARYAGGHNAGHTVIINGKKFILQLVPCGVLRPRCRSVIGNGVVLDPIAFLKEVAALRETGVQVDGSLFVSNRAHVILPYHRMIELASENAPGRVKIGTTSRGIGPAYEDKMGRRGLRVADLLDLKLLRTHIENACHEKNMIAHALFNSEPLDPDKMYQEYAEASAKVAPFVCDTAALLNQALADGESVLFEGAQGTMLDIDPVFRGVDHRADEAHRLVEGVFGGLRIQPLFQLTVSRAAGADPARAGEVHDQRRSGVLTPALAHAT